jgi:hypothetical protein
LKKTAKILNQDGLPGVVPGPFPSRNRKATASSNMIDGRMQGFCVVQSDMRFKSDKKINISCPTIMFSSAKIDVKADDICNLN